MVTCVDEVVEEEAAEAAAGGSLRGGIGGGGFDVHLRGQSGRLDGMGFGGILKGLIDCEE